MINKILKRIVFLILTSSSPFAMIEITGVENKEILELIKKNTISSIKYNNNDSESVANEYRLIKDRKTIKTILYSFGYFDSTISIDNSSNKIIFKIKLNERYKFSDILLKYTDSSDFQSGLTINQIFNLANIEPNSPTTTKQILEAAEAIKLHLENKGFAFVSVAKPEIRINRKTKRIKAIYKITLNGKVIIDKTIIQISSNKSPDLIEPFIRKRIPWKDNDPYSPTLFEEFKESVMESGIFSGCDVSLVDHRKDPSNPEISHANALIVIKEDLPRYISIGAKYGTSEKLGATITWAYYNIDGKGSKLSTYIDTSNILDDKKRHFFSRIKYTTPDVFYKKQDLKSQIFYNREQTLAYDVSKVGCESMLWQKFPSKLKIGAGLKAEQSNIFQTTTQKNFNAIGIPIGLSFDTSDVYLDPSRGFRVSSMLTPYFGNVNGVCVFDGRTSGYLPLKKTGLKNVATLAIYSRVGSVSGRDSLIPKDKLFFGGGANSIRGYGYQMLGEIGADGVPLGGKSIFEIGVEPRIKISQNVGVVFFCEGGYAHKSRFPKFHDDLLWGYGFGARYYTPLGPIRLDLAFPGKRRKDSNGKKIDSMFNIYISIGQAF